jgi:hypothetical protein
MGWEYYIGILKKVSPLATGERGSDIPARYVGLPQIGLDVVDWTG